jgi:hypothetical protein
MKLSLSNLAHPSKYTTSSAVLAAFVKLPPPVDEGWCRLRAKKGDVTCSRQPRHAMTEQMPANALPS